MFWYKKNPKHFQGSILKYINLQCNIVYIIYAKLLNKPQLDTCSYLEHVLYSELGSKVQNLINSRHWVKLDSMNYIKLDHVILN